MILLWIGSYGTSFIYILLALRAASQPKCAMKYISSGLRSAHHFAYRAPTERLPN